MPDFVGRIDEASTLAGAIENHQRMRRESGSWERGRGRNVLVFSGIGGFGKSMFSAAARSWLAGESAPSGWSRPPAVAGVARIDLRQSGGYIDGARELASLRMQLDSIRDQWTWFDQAFAAYWAARRPTELLPVFASDGLSNRAGVLGLFPELAEDLTATQHIDISGAEYPATISGLSVRAVETIVGRVRALVRATSSSAEPDGFADLFEQCCNARYLTDDAERTLLARLFELLAYEIRASSRGTEACAVVLLDTFERLELDPRHEGERLLNAAAWLMPNVLFLVTTRRELSWGEDQGPSMPYKGSKRWPALADRAVPSMRSRIARLDAGESEQVLRSFEPTVGWRMQDEFVVAVVERSHGWPVYLKLAGEAIARLADRSECLALVDLPSSFEDLVGIILEDASPDERRAIRASALFERPVPALVAVTAAVDEGAAIRAMSSSLFSPEELESEERRLHETIAAAIRSQDSRWDGAWSPADWRAAGARALAYLQDRWVELVDASERDVAENRWRGVSVDMTQFHQIVGDAIVVMERTGALPLASASGKYPNWVWEAVLRGPSIAGVRPHLPASPETEAVRAIVTFIEAKSPDKPPAAQIRILHELVERSPDLLRVVGRHLAYAQRNSGDWQGALKSFDLLTSAFPDSALFPQQYALTLAAGRRFPEAFRAAGTLTPRMAAAVRARIAATHGEREPYLAWDLSTTEGLTAGIRDALENRATRFRWIGLLSGAVDRTELAEVRRHTELLGHESAVRDAIVAEVAVNGCTDEGSMERLIRIDRAKNNGQLGFREAFARSAQAFYSGEGAEIEAVNSEMRAQLAHRSDNWIPTEFLLSSLGYAVDDQGADWLEPRSVVESRWTQIWTGWKTRTSAKSRSAGATWVGITSHPVADKETASEERGGLG